MKLEIFDKDSRERVWMIKAYTYAAYTQEFYGAGSFSIKIPTENDSMPYLVYGNYVLFDDGVMGIIKGVKNIEGEGDDDEIEVYGYLTNHILSYRSILYAKRYYGKIPEVFRTMFTELFVSPDDEKRKIDYVTLSETFPDVGKKQTVQNSGKDFLTVCNEIGIPYDIGVELYPVIVDYYEGDSASTNLSALEFRVIHATDRTLDNQDGNDPVVFSFDLNNLKSIEYEEDGRNFCSVAFVASEGQGENRKTLEVGDTSKTGMNRIELYVDARDIQSDNSGGSGGGGCGEGGDSGLGLYAFEVRDDGHLWMKYQDGTNPGSFSINSDGHLICVL